jgi:2-hydroxycyclohexanecarboxyl-CoA dehydrogenase
VYDLGGRVALITGGTAGIGLEIARSFLSAGATVVVNGRDERKGAAAIAQLAHERAFFEAGNCSDSDAARQVVARTVARCGRLTTLVASGGAADIGPGLFSELADDAFIQVYRTQMLNRVYPIRAALPHMQANGGSIIIIGTDAGRHATVGEALHGGLGAAKIMLTKTLAREFGRWNIRVNGLALTVTAGTAAFDEAMARNDWVTRLFEKAIARFPAGRPPTAEEVARVALFFASNQSAQVTGQTLSVNGGLSFGGW